MNIFIDTNSLLNIVFVDSSFSKRAIDLSLKLNHQLYISKSIYKEAICKIEEFSSDYHIYKLSLEIMNNCLEKHKIIVVDDSLSHSFEPTIPKNDQHVYHCALKTNALLLTSDIDLLIASRSLGLDAKTPIELLHELDQVNVSSMFFGVKPNDAKGSIFIRAFPGPWSGLVNSGSFTLFHIENFGRVYYDTSLESWVADLQGFGINAKIKKSSKDLNNQEVIALSWSDDSLFFRVSSIAHPKQARIAKKFIFDDGLRFSLGSYKGKDYWNGGLFHCIWNDKPISKSLWKKLLKTPYSAPNPFELDRVKVVINSLA